MDKGVRFVSVSEIIGSIDLALILLADEAHERQISIVCSRDMAVQLDMRVKQLPITQRMLPEVFSSVISGQTSLRFYIFINDISDGQYNSALVNSDTGNAVPIRVSDAVLLSVAGDIPLYIDDRLMRQQSVIYRNPSVEMSVDMLDKAIERAIKSENYEQASLLTEERNRRISGKRK